MRSLVTSGRYNPPAFSASQASGLKEAGSIRIAALLFQKWGIAMLAALFIWHSNAASGSERLSEWLDLPPAMLRLIGDPKVKLQAGNPPEGTVIHHITTETRPGAMLGNKFSKIRVIRVPASMDSGEIRIKSELAKSVLNHLWRTQFQESDFELIEITRKRFFQIGYGQLLGRPISNDIEGNAWWRVRMDVPLTDSNRYHLITMVVRYSVGNTPYGHFALGIRQNRGNVGADFAIDPRAPWEDEDPPGIKDWLMPSADLINGIHTSNLYDWLYTQTNFRGMKVDMDFYPLAREQAVLMKNLQARKGSGNYGRFGTLRNNCATIGQNIIEALMPVDKKLSMRHPIADMPDRVAKKTREKLKITTKVILKAANDENGPKPTANWTIRRPKSRSATAEFTELRQVPEIN